MNNRLKVEEAEALAQHEFQRIYWGSIEAEKLKGRLALTSQPHGDSWIINLAVFPSESTVEKSVFIGSGERAIPVVQFHVFQDRHVEVTELVKPPW